MKWLKIGAAFVIIAAVAVVVIFPRINSFQREGQIVFAGLKAPVKVFRDENGMAYIYAENEDDFTVWERGRKALEVTSGPGVDKEDAVPFLRNRSEVHTLPLRCLLKAFPNQS